MNKVIQSSSLGTCGCLSLRRPVEALSRGVSTARRGQKKAELQVCLETVTRPLERKEGHSEDQSLLLTYFT